ncbi:hypothetical protein ACQ4PT_034721 [Festuca glaucescens]
MDLDAIFSEEEVWRVVQDLPPDRAPGPDGFIGMFYQKAWGIIRGDVMAAILKLAVGDGRGFGRLNRSLVTSIPKWLDAIETGDFRPISLVHSFGKLFSKLIANCLRNHLGELVSSNQSAFVHGRCLHDNFMLVRKVARRVNSRRQSRVLLKFDLSRAFDSLSWAFLFEVLRQLGFGTLFLKWISLLLSTASIRIVVNGVPGKAIKMVRGLRQGNPTSPQLFVIAMEVLTLLVVKYAERGLLTNLPTCTLKQRISIYADDVAMFVKPEVHDLVAVRTIFHMFGDASGLRVNYNKTSATDIRGDAHDKMRVKHVLQCEIGEFPCKYLGLHLSTRELTKAQWQPVLDQVIASLPAWQRGLLARSGRLVLIKAVVMARPIHQLLVADAPAWLLEEINKWTRGFFWVGKEAVNGGQCLIPWQQICKPICYGGLGVKNLKLQGLALRVRWEWLRRSDPNRPWQGLSRMQDPYSLEVFDSLVAIRVGDGAKTLFWHDRWVNGAAVKDFAPEVYAKVITRTRNHRTVKDAFANHKWIGDVRGNLSNQGLVQCLLLFATVCTFIRDARSPDSFSWPWSTSGQYTAASTYRVLCQLRYAIAYS